MQRCPVHVHGQLQEGKDAIQKESSRAQGSRFLLPGISSSGMPGQRASRAERGQASNCSRQAYPKPCPSLGGQDQCSISQESSLEPGGQLLPWERTAQRKEGVPSYTNQAKLNLALKTKTASHPAFIFMLANLQMLLGSVRVGACVRVSVLTET